LPVKLPTRATLALPVTVVAQGATTGLPPLEESPTVVGVHVHVAKLGERASKGWVLTPEQLGEGWKSMAGSFVNMGHQPGELYGSIRAVAQADGAIYAALALSRAKLQAENIDPARLTTDFSVSSEWTYQVDQTYVEHNGEKLTMEEAAERELLALNTIPSGGTEIIAASADATIYPGGVQFGDIALVPLTTSRPAFPSAAVLAASAADGKPLQFSDSLEAFLTRVLLALRQKFSWRTFDGYWERPWVVATYADAVVFQLSEIVEAPDVMRVNTYKCSIEVGDNGEITLGDKTPVEVDEQYLEKSENARAALANMVDEDPAMPVGAEAAILDFTDILYGEGAAPKAKSGGHKSPPAGYPKERSKYADGANYMYPLDTEEHVRAAISYFRYAVRGRRGLHYSKAELTYMAKKIVRAAARFGISVNPKSLVGKYAGVKTGTSSAKLDWVACAPFIEVLYGEGMRPRQLVGTASADTASEEFYGDPTNKRFPLRDAEQISGSLAEFNVAVASGQSPYTRPELVFIAKRLVAAAWKCQMKVEPTSWVGVCAGLAGLQKIRRGGEVCQ